MLLVIGPIGAGWVRTIGFRSFTVVISHLLYDWYASLLPASWMLTIGTKPVESSSRSQLQRHCRHMVDKCGLPFANRTLVPDAALQLLVHQMPYKRCTLDRLR
jgi:hypothetical protein